MTIYEFANYKLFLQELLKTLPRKGHGQARKLSEHLGVNSVVISQVLSGDRHFTPEQALSVGAYFGFDERATEYFVNLIHKDRSGTVELASYYEKQLSRLREESLKLKNRVVQVHELTDEDKGIFYSNWYFVAVRISVSLPGVDNVDTIATRLGLSRAKTAEIVNYLKGLNLLAEENGKLKTTTQSTYIAPTSPFINNHRRNWRLKAIDKFPEPGPNDVFGSFIYSLSADDIQQIRKELSDLVAKFSKRVRSSPEEKLACFNFDWFEF